MSSAKIIQLRHALAEKFPHLRTRWDEASLPAPPAWKSGWAALDASGGLPLGALTEIIASGPRTGSATLLHALLDRAAAEQKIITLVDGSDTLDVTQLPPPTLRRLLWIRSRSAEGALKALDLILRDANLGFVLVDLVANPPEQLRRLPGPVWYRFQRLLEATTTVCVILTPQRLVLPAALQVNVRADFSLNALESEREYLLTTLHARATNSGRETGAMERVA